MHIKRWITALVGVPVFIYTVSFAPLWMFALLLCFLAVAAFYEFLAMTGSLDKNFWIYAFITPLIFFVSLSEQNIKLLPGLLGLIPIIALSLAAFSSTTLLPETFLKFLKTTAGFLYTVIPLALLFSIHFMPYGHLWIFFLFINAVGTDTGAFYFGRALGKRSLAPILSPKKTWEGAIGGTFTGVSASFLFIKFTELSPNNLQLLLLAVLLSVVGQLGDLAESMIKRNVGVKDSGKLLPGHGGVLDRIDGLLFSIPVFFLYLSITLN